jgi:outer membrane protein TolC
MRNTALLALTLAALAPSLPAQDAPAGPLTLTQAIQSVLARYPTISAAQAAVDAARARSMQANADRLPQVTGQAGYTYNSLRPYVAIAIPGLPPGAIYENVQDAYGANITARQLLTDFGRTDRLVDMARSGQITARTPSSRRGTSSATRRSSRSTASSCCAAQLTSRGRRSGRSRRPCGSRSASSAPGARRSSTC